MQGVRVQEHAGILEVSGTLLCLGSEVMGRGPAWDASAADGSELSAKQGPTAEHLPT